ncbi:RNA-binding transcriptional accessory protein [endosymbiont 'TC1' of Trimyema compressum]|uniref:helix-hairpin-helix domain-containing protein n=1 Tax=endosymbiont 'TC1' of Trimyema compressum TaxID=243899 RepID=UPI0007F0EE3B|nr:Tex family protein [endosymbiont 'TC1' of Trimyema compressum]AMP21032.1 RNA-binding transcriptional accessory protein [endosymbiont 'TC1' of Trimyema compressum]
MDIVNALGQMFPFKPSQIKAALELKEDGNTIPFIARYRKERTGGLLDEELRVLFEKADYYTRLEERKVEVKNLLKEQENLTDELDKSIDNATILTEIEDIYRPFKPKKNTKGSIAKKKGLEPLALEVLNMDKGEKDAILSQYVNPDKEVLTLEEALEGAGHVIAEMVSDSQTVRDYIRQLTRKNGLITSKGKETGKKDKDGIYDMYHDYQEPFNAIKNHRVLALLRGEKEGALSIKIEFNEEQILQLLDREYKVSNKLFADELRGFFKDSLKRLLFSSLERELFAELKERSEEGAIDVFKKNLKQLLLISPVNNQVILGFDPAFRTGCKLAVINQFGQVLDTAIIFPMPPQKKFEESKKKLLALIKKYGITAIAVGNGTASRESEAFLVEVLKETVTTAYTIVNEAGASVYSASSVARDEFPDMDVNLRSAVSIARRLLDPLAELVKISPKAIGVGQYQHDVNQKKLEGALDGVVENCVNFVGVDVNNASVELLSYVAGLNTKVAKAMYSHRQEHGTFKNRKAFLKLKGLGPKGFSQCAGFLRIKDGDNFFDNTGIHPESYWIGEALLNGEEISGNELKETIADIKKELEKPGREPREDLPKPIFKREVLDIEQLHEGMIISGAVRNIVDFGAFIDIGVHEDALVHISQITNRFIKHPLDVLEIGQVVKSKIISLDKERNRIGLTLREVPNEE